MSLLYVYGMMLFVNDCFEVVGVWVVSYVYMYWVWVYYLDVYYVCVVFVSYIEEWVVVLDCYFVGGWEGVVWGIFWGFGPPIFGGGFWRIFWGFGRYFYGVEVGDFYSRV